MCVMSRARRYMQVPPYQPKFFQITTSTGTTKIVCFVVVAFILLKKVMYYYEESEP